MGRSKGCECPISNSNIAENLILLHSIFRRSSINEKKTLHPRPLEFSTEAQKIAENSDFQLAGYCFEADKESTRAPRVVRIGNQSALIFPDKSSFTGYSF